MVYLSSPEEFLSESRLLLSARPLTTRVTTTYSLPRPRKTSSKITKDGPEPATLVLKTFDPASGSCLKYKTRKATELGRLLGALRTSAGVLAGVKLDESSASTSTAQAVSLEEKNGKDGKVDSQPTAAQAQTQGQGQSTGGQGQEKSKKKKKGKK